MPYKNPKDEGNRSRRYRSARRAAFAEKAPNRYNVAMGAVRRLAVKGPAHGLKIAFIPDVQAMDGVPLDHLAAAGKYIAAKRPDVVVCIGDFWDFPSLSQFGSAMEFEGRRYKKDLGAGHRAMDLLMTPIAKEKGYHPSLEFCDGNHEGHIDRAVNNDPKLEGLMSRADLRLADYGWREHDFLQPISIGGVAFCHYFPSGVMGKAISTAPALMSKLHMSACAGHVQDRSICFGRRADGSAMTTIVSGSFYQHDYKYLSPFTNRHWRGLWLLHEVRDGQFDEMALSIDYLRRRFG